MFGNGEWMYVTTFLNSCFYYPDWWDILRKRRWSHFPNLSPRRWSGLTQWSRWFICNAAVRPRKQFLFLIAVYFFFPTQQNPFFPLFTFFTCKFLNSNVLLNDLETIHTRQTCGEGCELQHDEKTCNDFKCPASLRNCMISGYIQGFGDFEGKEISWKNQLLLKMLDKKKNGLNERLVFKVRKSEIKTKMPDQFKCLRRECLQTKRFWAVVVYCICPLHVIKIV